MVMQRTEIIGSFRNQVLDLTMQNADIKLVSQYSASHVEFGSVLITLFCGGNTAESLGPAHIYSILLLDY